MIYYVLKPITCNTFAVDLNFVHVDSFPFIWLIHNQCPPSAPPISCWRGRVWMYSVKLHTNYRPAQQALLLPPSAPSLVKKPTATFNQPVSCMANTFCLEGNDITATRLATNTVKTDEEQTPFTGGVFTQSRSQSSLYSKMKTMR